MVKFGDFWSPQALAIPTSLQFLPDQTNYGLRSRSGCVSSKALVLGSIELSIIPIFSSVSILIRSSRVGIGSQNVKELIDQGKDGRETKDARKTHLVLGSIRLSPTHQTGPESN